MVDTITDEDVERMDDHVDPTDLNTRDIQQAFRNKRSEQDGSDMSNFVKGGARKAFADRIDAKRKPVRDEATRQLSDQISQPGANGQRQLYGRDPETGRNTFVGTARNIEVEVGDNGEVFGVNQNTGTRAKVGSVDLGRRA